MKPSSVVHSDPDILGGAQVFIGTRVPVEALIDYLEGGHSLDGFLDDFPTVSRELAVAALEQAKAHLRVMQSVIHSDPDIQGGAPVFVSTRVPVKNLFDYLETGDSLEKFLKSFPSVTREHAVAALELAREVLAPGVRRA